MILQEIIDRVMRNTGHIYNDVLHIIDLINNALIMLASDAKIQAVQTYSVTPGQAEYALPADFKAPIALIEGSIDNPIQIYKQVDITSPERGFTIYADKIILKPTPSNHFDVNFYYYAYPAQMKDYTDPLPIDDRYGEALAAYASAMILSLPGVSGFPKHLIDRYFQIWEEARFKFRQDMQLKTKQQTVRKAVLW